MKIGDLITTYYKGIWRLTRIERRFRESGEEYNPLFYFTQVCTFEGKEAKRENCCDSHFCKPAGEYIKKEEERLEKIKQYLK